MINDFLKLRDYLNDPKIKFAKNELKSVIQDYSFLHIIGKENINENEKQYIIKNTKESKVIINDHIEDYDKRYLIIGFEKTIIFHEYSLSTLSFLQELFSNNNEMYACFFPTKISYFDDLILIANLQIEVYEIFLEEIRSLSYNFRIWQHKKEINQIWPFIVPCISAYFIKKSILQRVKNRITIPICDFKTNEKIS